MAGPTALKKFCQKCREFIISEGFDFCLHCGSRLIIPRDFGETFRYCERCKSLVTQEGINFCPKCGKYFKQKAIYGPKAAEGGL